MGSVADLVSTLEDGPNTPPVDSAVRQALSRFRQEQTAYCDPSAFNRRYAGGGALERRQSARDLVEGSGQGLAMADLFNFRLNEHAELRDRYGFPRWDLDHEGAGGDGVSGAQARRGAVHHGHGGGGLDTHDENWAADQLERQKGGWDRAAMLIADLKATNDPDVPSKRLIDTTTIVCFSEFSRTPKLNVRNGRDHAIVNSAPIAWRRRAPRAAVRRPARWG